MLPSDSLLVQLAKSWLRLLECSVDWQSCHSSTSLPLLHSLSLFVLLSFFFFFSYYRYTLVDFFFFFPFQFILFPFPLLFYFLVVITILVIDVSCLIERNPFFFPPIFSNPVHPPLISLVIPSPRAPVKLPSLHRLSSVYTVKCPALISVGKHCKFLLTRLPSRYHVKLAESIDHLCGSDAFLPPPPYFDPLAKTGKNSEKGKKKKKKKSSLPCVRMRIGIWSRLIQVLIGKATGRNLNRSKSI